ncbi:MAG TPA: membrane dipeptidase [Candidatus Udaeobacter sp.]|nr:membrane dipeptidase [Candidatus Udaeobacter sp.]
MLSRRQFTKIFGGAATLAAIRPGALWSSAEPAAVTTPASVSPGAAELYRKAFVLDGNVLGAIGFLASIDDSASVSKRIVGSGVNVVKSTLGGPDGNFEEAVAAIAKADLLIEKHPEAFFNVQRAADFDRAKNEGKLGIIYSFESPNMLEDKIARIELFRSLGVRVMQLTYNHRTPFGCGCLDGDSDGLTDLGHSAVAKMNELGVALDLSHSNAKTTAEGIASSKKPVLITHAGCRAVYMHPRNKDDRELKALADKGGVIGIYMLPFLTEPPTQPMLKDYLQHLDHAVKICGEDHVGIGSDVPFLHVGEEELAEMKRHTEERRAAGIAAPGEDRPAYIPDLNTERKLELVTDALLKRGYKSAVIEKILGGNFKRVLADIWSV